MANFDLTAGKRQAVRDAANLVPNIQGAYNELKLVQALLARYTTGTDTAFVAAVNALFLPAERTELGQTLSAIGALVTDLETNHASLIGIG